MEKRVARAAVRGELERVGTEWVARTRTNIPTAETLYKELIRSFFGCVVRTECERRGTAQIPAFRQTHWKPSRFNPDVVDAIGLSELGALYEYLLSVEAYLGPAGKSFVLKSVNGNRRKNSGSYYTPDVIVQRVLDGVLTERTRLVYDPTCGAGYFLLGACKRIAMRHGGGAGAFRDAVRESAHGRDIDPIAVEIAKTMLCWEMLDAFRVEDFAGIGIYTGDALGKRESRLPTNFDCIVGNPPWVSFSGRQRVAVDDAWLNEFKKNHPAVEAWPALHSAVLLRSLTMLTANGGAGFVLPLQVAELASYAEVRREATRLATVTGPVLDVGERAFPGVVQPVGVYHFRRAIKERDGVTTPWKIAPLRVIGLKAGSSEKTLEGIRRQLRACPRFPLKTFADVGVHSGNVAQKIILPCGTNLRRARFAPIREGRNIDAYFCGAPTKVIDLKPVLGNGEYCTIRRLNTYTEFPVVLRQTANRPIAARHSDRAYFRNSIIACRGISGVCDLVLIAFLNSALFAYLHRNSNIDAGQKAFPQVKIRHLQALPSAPMESLQPLGRATSLAEELEELAAQAETEAATAGNVSPDLLLAIERMVLRTYALPVDAAELLVDAAIH